MERHYIIINTVVKPESEVPKSKVKAERTCSFLSSVLIQQSLLNRCNICMQEMLSLIQELSISWWIDCNINA